MNTLRVSNFKDLMNGHLSAQIINPLDNKVVRTLRVVQGEIVEILAADGTELEVPLTEEISYEPWPFDRGSMLFGNECVLKICTEADIILFPNGDRFLIFPPVSAL